MRRLRVLGAASLVPLFAGIEKSLAAFPSPVTDSPIDNYVAQINVNYNQVQSFSEPIGLDPNTYNSEPDVYWFKYVSNGNTEVTFDTLGSNFGTNGPGGGSGGGQVLGESNDSQIAVYTATGTPVAISKSTTDINGNPIPIYPTFSSDPTQWYVPEGLSQLTFEPNAPQNPHWNVSPTSPTPYTGWSAPGNSGNSQKYYPPYYETSLNEYQVWNTSLSTVILDNNGNPVIDPSTGKPYPQPGWRYSDYDNVGPGSTWNRYNVLPAGTYYVAVASDDPVLSGDIDAEKVLEDPVWYDPTTGQNNVAQLSSNMGPWQYYENTDYSGQWGTITLNVTQTPLPSQLAWNNAGGSGDGVNWDSSNANWNNGTGTATFSAGSDVIFNDSNNGHYSVTLNSSVSPNFVYVDNNSGNYVISGTGGITGTGNLDKNGSGTLTLSTVNSYTGGTAVDGGTLVVGVNGALPVNQALEIHNGAVARLAPNTGLATLSSLYLSDQSTLDITNNHLIINYGSGTDPIASIAASIASGYANGTWTGTGITSSAAEANGVSYGIGYADAADPGNPAGLASGQIEVMYTLLGDANLDGKVNSIDFAVLASNFNKAVVGSSGWDQGDFNYDGHINSEDFADLAENFNKGASQAAEVAALDAFAAAYGLETDVPEPATLGSICLAAGIFGLRKRSRKHT